MGENNKDIQVRRPETNANNKDNDQRGAGNFQSSDFGHRPSWKVVIKKRDIGKRGGGKRKECMRKESVGCGVERSIYNCDSSVSRGEWEGGDVGWVDALW
jgi:hypothetical protein